MITVTGPKGSEQWMKGIRKKAKDISKSVTMDYVELASTLWEIYDTPIDGDPNNPGVFTRWGFNKFTDFAQEELGVSPRKANYLKAIGFKIKVELKDVDPEWMERFLLLGWCKVREISRVVKAHQVKDWVLQAEQATFQEVEAMVVKYSQNERKAQEEGAAATGGYSISKDPFAPHSTDVIKEEVLAAASGDGVDVNVAVSGADFSSDIAVPPSFLTEPEPVSIAVPAPEKLITETFALYEEQHKNVKAALQKASQLSNSEKKSNNLSLICANFLATNDFSGTSEEQLLKFVARLEQVLGHKLIVADPDDYSVVYGLENLKKVAIFQVKQQQQQMEVVLTR